MATSRGQFQIEFLRSLADAGGKIVNARFSLQRGPLRRWEPFYALTFQQGPARSFQEFSWTPDLERFLLDLRISLANDSDESERLANILVNNVEQCGDEYGRDYARAVFIAVLRERPQFCAAALLDRVATPRVSTNGASYQPCYEALAQSVDGILGTARLELGYPPDRALAIATKAIEIARDELFHISSRDLLVPSHAQ